MKSVYEIEQELYEAKKIQDRIYFLGQEEKRKNGYYEDGTWDHEYEAHGRVYLKCRICSMVRLKDREFDYCGDFHHGSSCPRTSEAEVRKHLAAQMKANRNYIEKLDKAEKQRSFWEGKYHMVKHENNELTKKIRQAEKGKRLKEEAQNKE